MIDIKDCLTIMDNADRSKPFSIEFYTADRKKKTGGELLVLEKCILSKKKEKSDEIKEADATTTLSKKQNHWENSTRNILILSSNQIRKCHIRLIEKINGQTVIW